MSLELNRKQCLFLLPEADMLSQLQRLRLQYDPLARLIPPHITVVFPFAAALAHATLRSLVEQQRRSLPIPFALDEPRVKGDCLFFPLGVGREAVMALTKRVYAELPISFSLDASHIPHVTFGRLNPGQNAEAMLSEAAQALPLTGVGRRLILESIGEDGRSLPELEVCCE